MIHKKRTKEKTKYSQQVSQPTSEKKKLYDEKLTADKETDRMK